MSLKLRSKTDDHVVRGSAAPAAPSERGAEPPVSAERGGKHHLHTEILGIVRKYPFHVVNLASVPGVVAIMLAAGGFALFRSIWSSLSLSEPIGAALSALVALFLALYALLSTIAVSWIRAEEGSQGRDLAADRKLEEMSLSLSSLRQAVARLDEHVDATTELAAATREMISQSLTRTRPYAVIRKNNEIPWQNLAPGTEYFAVYPQGRFDVTIVISSNGERRYVANVERIEATILPRFDPRTALHQSHYILNVPKGTLDDPSEVPESVATQIATFATIRTLASKAGFEPTLDRVQFYLVEGTPPIGSLFAGVYNLGGSIVPFVNEYRDIGLQFGAPLGISDDRVVTSFHTEAVNEVRRIAETLRTHARAFSLIELERRFGSHVACDQVQRPASAPPARSADGAFREVIVNGDHLAL